MRTILLSLALLFTLSAQAQTKIVSGRLAGRVQSFWWLDAWGVQ